MVKARETLIPKPVDPPPTLKDPPPAAASVVGLSKRFGKTSVLENISFDVAEGEVLVLLGASGSGKTTILRIIAGLEMPYTGKVILHGKDVTELPARERGVGVIFQSYALFPKMTVEKNIGYGLRIRKRKRKEIKETVNELLKLVQLEEHRKKYPSQLSGGQQQRVAIARTLAYKPEVLLFDEPFGALDTQTRVHLRREIRALLRKVNVPSIFITHDQEEALELGDRVAVLSQGHIEQLGTPFEIYNRPATEYVATFLGAANILEATVKNGFVEVGAAHLPVVLDQEKFRNGDCVKIVFRPEDVVLSKGDFVRPGASKISAAGIEEITFVGAYERLRLRLDRGLDECRTDDSPYYLTTDTPESQSTKAIIATRPKPEAAAARLQIGDRVMVAISSFTVLPAPK
ncbi:MAG TPA: ABC transporter ATP-binding protein [Pyrinomonadaceae bacterium]|jgi:ABC-type Fe3+/spermidine/putrescine transport system ATPase subunit|nr:ABC transporter ATP-binding protein [Pyrinomonadaceae bacterium]